MHIVVVQYGPYRDAYRRLSEGGDETYYAQRYSVDFVKSLRRYGQVTVISLWSDPHDEMLADGLRAVGMRFEQDASTLDLMRVLVRLSPTHVILMTPLLSVLAWALATGVHVLPMLADSFHGERLRQRVKRGLLAMLARAPSVPVFANHNVPASRDLASIGVPTAKIVPWDWPSMITPESFAPKRAPSGEARFRMVFVGLLIEEKGITDCLRALRLLVDRGMDVSLTVAGSGEVDVQAAAEREGVAERVELLGRIPHKQVVGLMREHDVVLVPSRHEYPEGLPLTIYEALCSRTPLVISDHRMFRSRLTHGEDALVFRAKDASDLAGRVHELLTTPALYEGLSARSAEAWARLQCPVKSGELIERWLNGTPDDLSWLKAHSLAQYRYL